MNEMYVTASVPRPSCGDKCQAIEEPVRLQEERKIFDTMSETREALCEIMSMLDTFKREIRNYEIPTDECKKPIPSCFREDVDIVNGMVMAIRGDLHRIISEFR